MAPAESRSSLEMSSESKSGCSSLNLDDQKFEKSKQHYNLKNEIDQANVRAASKGQL